MMESFFGSLKSEWVQGPYPTKEVAKKEIFRYIEMFYNPIRRHASLDYMSPVQFEHAFHMGLLRQQPDQVA